VATRTTLRVKSSAVNYSKTNMVKATESVNKSMQEKAVPATATENIALDEFDNGLSDAAIVEETDAYLVEWLASREREQEETITPEDPCDDNLEVEETDSGSDSDSDDSIQSNAASV
jgi:hypothetical protein